MSERLLILGATGSIGRQAISILGELDRFDVVGLSAGEDARGLVELAEPFGRPALALADDDAAARLRDAWSGRVYGGVEAAASLIEATRPDIVLNAIVGAAGLRPSIATLAAGLPLALANKESLVLAGELLVPLAEGTGARIVPVDSEHSAVMQLIDGEPPGSVEKVILTASGGPFRERADLESVTVAEALDHPTWDMGGRITIDSATLMNKGFEMIEAHHLFGLPYDRIEVLVHPQSIVHSLVETADGAQLAHLGVPDMRVPIAYALVGPERADLSTGRLDLASTGALLFEPVDEARFPCLELARSAGLSRGLAPCTLNAADEVAVSAFLDGRIPFTSIPRVVELALDRVGAGPLTGFEEVFESDHEARAVALEIVETEESA